MDTAIIRPFSGEFLSQFFWVPQILPFTSEEIKLLDKELSEYEQVFLNPDIEKNLISKNELLASFAISKAENSKLTLQEAQSVYNLVIDNPNYDFISKKLRLKKKLTQKDHDQLEFFNIAKTFRKYNQESFLIKELTAEKILQLHYQLTQGLDIFKEYLSEFDIYQAGKLRDNDLIRVGSYVPAPHVQIKNGIEELIGWLKSNQTIDGTFVFHTALYALHPFNNGNKRVCRVLEHILLRNIGLNDKNLYSTSYYYHKQKPRYYKYLLYSLERRNLNHLVSFCLEALVLSIIDVVKTSLETKRNEFINKQELDGLIKFILKAFVKRGEIQFKNLARITRGKIARQTLVTNLQKGVEQGILNKREQGRVSYYILNFKAPEEKTLKKWLAFAKKRLSYIPNEIKLV